MLAFVNYWGSLTPPVYKLYTRLCRLLVEHSTNYLICLLIYSGIESQDSKNGKLGIEEAIYQDMLCTYKRDFSLHLNQENIIRGTGKKSRS